MKFLISLKIINKNGKKVRIVVTRKIKRIYAFIKAEKYLGCLFKLIVKYGDKYTNDGVYENKKDLIQALKAFTESD